MTVSGNKAVEVFDVQEAAATATLSGLTIADGTAGSGGGIGNSGMLTVTDCTITDNTASGSGGGIDNSGILTVTNTTIGFNSAVTCGGGIDNTGMLTIGAGSAISGNTAGTATSAAADLQLTARSRSPSSTVSDNTCQGQWRRDRQLGTLAVTDSTLSDNSATATAGGGGIYNSGGGFDHGQHTFLGNRAGTVGGGILTSAGALTITDCTISSRRSAKKAAASSVQDLEHD